ncbi:hypothetical protein SLE2022_403550 [Rubroshorea leprosula]
MPIQKTFLLFEAYESFRYATHSSSISDSRAAPSIANIALNSIALVLKTSLIAQGMRILFLKPFHRERAKQLLFEQRIWRQRMIGTKAILSQPILGIHRMQNLTSFLKRTCGHKKEIELIE